MKSLSKLFKDWVEKEDAIGGVYAINMWNLKSSIGIPDLSFLAEIAGLPDPDPGFRSVSIGEDHIGANVSDVYKWLKENDDTLLKALPLYIRTVVHIEKRMLSNITARIREIRRKYEQ